MAQPGLRLRHLVFHGPNRSPAALEFGPGLNLIYGASESGKSFVVEAIDFMLGGKQQLPDIPERRVDGGAFRVYSGLYLEPPADETAVAELADQHNERNYSNLSMFLLNRCGMDGKRVRKTSKVKRTALASGTLRGCLSSMKPKLLPSVHPFRTGIQ
jgi:DNA repair ATPase RecN